MASYLNVSDNLWQKIKALHNFLKILKFTRQKLSINKSEKKLLFINLLTATRYN